MNVLRSIVLICSILMVSFAAHADDFTINSKVYFGGVNMPSECANMEDLTKPPVYYGSELPEKFETKSVQTPGADPDQEIGLVSDFMNAYIKTSSRL